MWGQTSDTWTGIGYLAIGLGVLATLRAWTNIMAGVGVLYRAPERTRREADAAGASAAKYGEFLRWRRERQEKGGE